MEDKIRRRAEREEAAESQRQKERDRVASELAAFSSAGILSEEETDVEDDDKADVDYKHSGNEPKRSKTVTLDINIQELQESFSDRADRYQLSSRGRCSIFSDFIASGGVSLAAVPCSQSTMIRYTAYRNAVGLSVCRSFCQ